MKTRMLGYSSREFQKILEKNGFTQLRNGKGSHIIYVRGAEKVTIKNSQELCRCLTKRLIKEYDLKIQK